MSAHILIVLSTSRPCPTFTFAQEEFFLRFAEFEEKVKETERARAIYKYALDHMPRAQVRHITRPGD